MSVTRTSRRWRAPRAPWIVAAILIVALMLRLRGITFGLPALLDPDEPIFELLALKLLRDRTLNPGWFGHPGSTTIYALALVDLAVYVAGHLTSRFADPAAFTRAIYTDPAVVFLPGRYFILLCGLICVWLTWRLGRALFGDRVGLFAAALLAIDPIAIRYSQIIRTDMQMTVFLLGATWATVRFVDRGQARYLAMAGAGVGLACATKWPAAAVIAGVLGGCALRWRTFPDERRRAIALLALFGVSALTGLFVAAPFVFLDYATVLNDIRGEGQSYHLGATGGGPIDNLWWYLSGPLVAARGLPGLLLALAGAACAARASRVFRYAVLPIMATLSLLLVFQNLRWERWAVPLLPFFAISLAWACAWLTGRKARWRPLPARLGAAGLAVAVVLPPLVVGDGQAAERATDTRGLATAWLRGQAPAGSSVAIEYLAFDVLGEPWHFYFPAGDRGCVDVRENLAGKIRVSTVSKWRGTRPVVDIGSVAPATIPTCRTDFVVSSNWDRYRAEAARYPLQLRTYAAVTAGARLVATFRPEPGRVGGPVVRVWRLPRGRDAKATTAG